MNFLKRATTSILRRPGKTIILLLLVFILGSVIAGAISVEGAITNTDANLRRQMQPILSIEFDWQEWDRILLEEYDFSWETFDWDAVDQNDPDTLPPREPQLRPSDVRAIGDLDHVNFYDFITQTQLRSFSVERYGESWNAPGVPEWLDFRGSSSTDLVHIDQDMIDLVHGNQFSQNDLIPGGERAAAIVSEGFANTNNLALGSIFEAYMLIMIPEVDEDGNMIWSGGWGEADEYAEENIHAQIGMEFEIVGLFDIPIDDESNNNEDWERTNGMNIIYVPNWALEDIQRRQEAAWHTIWDVLDIETPEWARTTPDDGDEDDVQMRIIPLFVLDDPGDMDAFRESAAELLPAAHHFIDLSSAFDDIASSMETLQTIANLVLYVSIGATLLILSLLITLFLRDRRHEMGVYLALGEKKGKIISQILMEVLVTSFVAISLSIFVGTFISSAVSRNMLLNELTAEQSDDPWGGWGPEWNVFMEIGIPTNNMSSDEMIDAFDISLSAQTIGLFYAIGLGAVVLSTLVPVVYIVTLNPKKVLL